MDVAGIQRALGKRVERSQSIGGGAAGSVHRLWLDDGTTVVCKIAARGGLDAEAASLDFLAAHSSLPVPRVLHAARATLVMTDIPGEAGADGADGHAAAVLADLHGQASPDGRFGLAFDNTIGPLPQPNAWAASWVEFYRERRVLHMARAARDEGAIDAGLLRQIESLAARLGELIPDRPTPSLIHGDVWSGNVLTHAGRVTGFVDPSPYYAHAEVELAFIDLFSTFGRSFHDAYDAARGTGAHDQREFERTRRTVYQVYPLLVHARLFRGGYVAQVAGALSRLGFSGRFVP
ncbi:MAG: fructosamine kinase family protein [Phycisphaerae bacterium]|nr:fructosamine kinase family protein [Phycisphaerae bacterium]